MKFNTSLASMLMLCAAAIPTTAFAASVHYNINFTGTGIMPTGAFDYDAAAPTFSNFVVYIGSDAYDMTSKANNQGNYRSCQGPAGAAAAFSLLDGSCTAREWSLSFGSVFVGVRNDGQIIGPLLFGASEGSGSGSFTISEASADAPEPATLSLIFLGGLGVFAARRKFARN